MKKTMLKLTKHFYEKFFGAKITDDVYSFITSLFYVFIGFMFAKGLLFVLQIIAGRMLGPSEYGIYNLVASVAFIFSIFMLAGLHYSTTKYLGAVKNEKTRKRIISTSIISTLITTTIFLVLFILLRNQIIVWFKLTPWVFTLALIFSVLNVAYLFSRFVLQGLHFMKKLSIVEALYSIGTFTGFFVLVLFMKNHIAVVGGYSIGYILCLILTIIFIKRFISLKLDKFYAKKLFNYALFAFFMTSSGVLLGSVDKLMLNYFLDYATIGIYQAYFFSSMSIVGILVQIFLTVYFPTIVKYKKKRKILARVDKLFLPILIGVSVLFPFAEYAALRFYGSEYPISNLLLILFAVSAAVFAIRNLYLWLQNSRGVHGVKVSAIGMLFTLVVKVVLNYLLIPTIHISGAAIASIVANIFFIVFLRYKLKNLK